MSDRAHESPRPVVATHVRVAGAAVTTGDDPRHYPRACPYCVKGI